MQYPPVKIIHRKMNTNIAVKKFEIIKSTNCQKEGSPSPFSHTCEVFDPIACKGRSLQLLIRLRAFSRSRVASTSHVRVSHQLGVRVTFPGPDCWGWGHHYVSPVTPLHVKL